MALFVGLGDRLSRLAQRHAPLIFPAPAVVVVALIIVYPVLYTGWIGSRPA